MSVGKKALIIGKVGTGKTSGYFPNKDFNVTGWNPEETFIIQCAGRGKELPMPGWETIFKADQKVKSGGHYAATRDVKLIRTMISHISKNRPEINNILIDDADFTLGMEILSSEDKFEYEDWRILATKVFTNLIDYCLNNKETDRLNIFFNFHSNVDKFGTVEAKVGGNMISNYAELEGLFSTVLYTKVVFNSITSKNEYMLVTQNQPSFPAKSLPGCFDEIIIPNDMGVVLTALKNYGK